MQPSPARNVLLFRNRRLASRAVDISGKEMSISGLDCSNAFPVRDYLAAVLPGLADCPIQRLPELTHRSDGNAEVLSVIACSR